MDELRTRWSAGSHEHKVESFYSIGAERFGDCHGGYLNFGLWDGEGWDYLRAAENLVHHLASWGGLADGSTALDVGCGFGAQDVYLARHFRPRSITGIDVAWAHVLESRRRAQAAGLGPSVQFQHGSATDLRAFGSGSFSHVLAVEGIVHFDTRARFFAQAHRVLEPGGQIVLADYALRRVPRGLLDRIFVALACAGWRIPRENAGTLDDYRAALAGAGFVDIAIVSAGERTIPQYFREQRSRAHLRALRDIRGSAATWFGLLIDTLVYWAWARGQLDYVLARARKPPRS
ncbi:MAG: 27-O-demethylrifamycin SV methyltransferase [Myxococcales bacterium]